MPHTWPLHHETIHNAVRDLFHIAGSDGLLPFCVAVCDEVGDLTYFARMSGSVRRVAAIARAKARTAAVMHCTTRSLHERLVQEQITLDDLCQTGLTSIAGGVPLQIDKRIIGGVGVSGRTPEQDEAMSLKLVNLLLH